MLLRWRVCAVRGGIYSLLTHLLTALRHSLTLLVLRGGAFFILRHSSQKAHGAHRDALYGGIYLCRTSHHETDTLSHTQRAERQYRGTPQQGTAHTPVTAGPTPSPQPHGATPGRHVRAAGGGALGVRGGN